MALTAEEQRKVYVHLDVEQIDTSGALVGGLPMLTARTHLLQAAVDGLTTNGEATARELLATLDTLRTELAAVRTRMQASAVGAITLNPREWADRQTQYDWYRARLARTLGLDLAELHPFAGALQGPWREP